MGIRGRSIEFSACKYYREIRHLYMWLVIVFRTSRRRHLITPLAYPKSFTHLPVLLLLLLFTTYRVICRLQRNSRDQPEVIAL